MLSRLPAGQRPALVLLRSPARATEDDPYRTTAIDAGFNDVHLLTVLSTSFTNLARLAEVLATGTEGYDGVIMTSARSAEAWAAAAATLSSSSSSDAPLPATSSSSPRPPFFVVGQGTRTALLERLPEALRPPEEAVLGAEETGTGESLARFILEHFERVDALTPAEGARRRRRLLYLTGDKNRDTLPSILAASSSPRIDLDPLQVYATSTDPSFSAVLPTLLTSLSPFLNSTNGSPLQEWPIRTVYFALFSPSSALPLITLLRSLSLLPAPSSSSLPPAPPTTREGRPSLRLRFAAIGPTTRDYLERELGVEVHATAAKPDAGSLVEAVVEAVRREAEERGSEGRKGEKEGRL